MKTARLIQAISLLAVVAALVAAAAVQGVVNRSRKALELVPTDDPFEAMPHDVALAVAALGSFRGIAVDYLWIRADRLKEQGKHYEALQLADMICRLQPRFPTVWSFQAWNMAWNISVTTHTPEERWLWVRNGLRLLRDQGIPKNPHAIKLYHDLAWIFLNKMGDNLDDMHMAYKRKWAYLMQRLLGPAAAQPTREELIKRLEPLAKAPDSLEQLRSARPELNELLQQLAALGIDLSAGYRPGAEQHPLEESFFERYNRLVSPQKKLLTSLSAKQQGELDESDRKFRQLLSRPELAKSVEALLAFLRAKVLRERYKLDPQRMIECVQRYGPLDWRGCDAHAIYWASLGDQMAAAQRRGQLSRVDLLNTRRFIFFALASIVRRGRVIFVPNPDDAYRSYYLGLPDLRFVDTLHRTYLQLGKDESEAGNDKAAEAYQFGHANFLADAIRLLYIDGQIAKAAEYYDYLRRTYKEPDGSPRKIYLMTLYDFVMRNFRRDLSSQKTAAAVIYDMLWQAYQELALGNVPTYQRRLAWSRRIYQEYMKDKREDLTARRQLPPFEQMKAGALATYLLYGPLHEIYKVQLWRTVPVALKRTIYDQVRPGLQQICTRAEWDIDKAFPEPPGMQQYRQTHRPLEPARQASPEPAPRIGL